MSDTVAAAGGVGTVKGQARRVLRNLLPTAVLCAASAFIWFGMPQTALTLTLAVVCVLAGVSPIVAASVLASVELWRSLTGMVRMAGAVGGFIFPYYFRPAAL